MICITESRDCLGGLGEFAEWLAVQEVEDLWAPLAKGPRGQLAAYGPEAWVVGPGSAWLMAPFAFQAPGRFGDGAFGVLYAALERATAIAELAHSRACFLRKAHCPRELLDNQLLTLTVTARMADLRPLRQEAPGLYDPEDWKPAQALGARLRQEGWDGVAYASVRHPPGTCVAGFRPTLFAACAPADTLQFYWDGTRLQGPAGLRA